MKPSVITLLHQMNLLDLAKVLFVQPTVEAMAPLEILHSTYNKVVIVPFHQFGEGGVMQEYFCAAGKCVLVVFRDGDYVTFDLTTGSRVYVGVNEWRLIIFAEDCNLLAPVSERIVWLPEQKKEILTAIDDVDKV